MTERIDRRVFLQKSAALGATILAGGCAATDKQGSPAGLVAPRRGPNEELRVACIGFNGQGGWHIGQHAGAPNVRVVTLCDIDERVFAKGLKMLADKNLPAPKTEFDIRRVLDDKDVDCVSIATPNHWHSLATIWACQAGKDVYVEKPCSHNIFEGRKMVEAAAKYGRIVQHGTQNRSIAGVQEAMNLLRQGAIGEVYMARALCFKNRNSIGIKEDEPAPEGVHYDNWLGPATERAFNPNRFHYNWHWNWDYGNGDIGNQGVHQMDVAVWGLGKDRILPVKVSSMGGRYTYEDQGVTPNTQVATFQYDDGKMMVFEVRGRQTNDEWGVGIGNLFYGSKGYMALRGNKYETMIDGQPGPTGGGGDNENFTNFHACVRSRDVASLNAPADIAHCSSAHCHLANIAYRLGRTLEFDPKTERFQGDAKANAMLTRDYRKGYVVPERV